MRYHGKHEVNFNIKLDGTLSGTVLASPEDVKDQLHAIDARVHKAIAREFRGEAVDYELDTKVEIDEPRITTKDVVEVFDMSFPAFFPEIFEGTERSVFEDIVDSCIDDINQEIIDDGYPDPQEVPRCVIVKCTWRAIAMGMKREA